MGTLRFLLALAVATGHATGTFGFALPGLLGGTYAVQSFYVISGFLIALILDGKYSNTAEGVWLFYSNRGLRIFVPYLVILLGSIGGCLVFRLTAGKWVLLAALFAEADRLSVASWIYVTVSNLLLLGTEWSYMLVYRAGGLFFDVDAYNHPPMATQFIVDLPAWSLSIELCFYALAPFLLRRHWLPLAVLAGALQWLRFLAYHHGFYSTATEYRFFPFELGLFLLGALACRARGSLIARGRWVAIITACIAALVLYMPQHFINHPYRFYLLLALALPSLLQFTNDHRWDRWLGELSYPLYICHWPVLAFAAALAGGASQPIWPILCVIISIILSVVVHHAIVVPVDRWRQRRLKRVVASSDIEAEGRTDVAASAV